jgi:hypothetical protein
MNAPFTLRIWVYRQAAAPSGFHGGIVPVGLDAQMCNNTSFYQKIPEPFKVNPGRRCR